MPGCATQSVRPVPSLQSVEAQSLQSGDAEFPFAIDFVPYAANWGRFAPGDDITVTAVRGDRKHIEPGGRYMVMGTYTLSSRPRARLGLSVTVTARDVSSPGARTRVDPEQVTIAVQGKHAFVLKQTMDYPGSFHVSFTPMEGGNSISTIYFRES
jgi:hypothetical protein